MSISINKSKVVKVLAFALAIIIAVLIPMTANAASSATIRNSGYISLSTGDGYGPFYCFRPQLKITTDKDISITIEDQKTGAIKYVNVNKGTTKISLERNRDYWIYTTGRGAVFGSYKNLGATVTFSNSYSCKNFRVR